MAAFLIFSVIHTIMKKIILFLSFCTIVSSASGQSKSISGYSDELAKSQLAVESKFDSFLSPSNLDIWMKKLAARPHHLGSPYGKESAIYIRDLFKSWGYDTEIETYKVLFPTPRVRLLELTAPKKMKMSLR